LVSMVTYSFLAIQYLISSQPGKSNLTIGVISTIVKSVYAYINMDGGLIMP